MSFRSYFMHHPQFLMKCVFGAMVGAFTANSHQTKFKNVPFPIYFSFYAIIFKKKESMWSDRCALE